jgi:hypothetical protein
VVRSRERAKLAPLVGIGRDDERERPRARATTYFPGMSVHDLTT